METIADEDPMGHRRRLMNPLPRLEWIGKELTLFNDNETVAGKGFVQFTGTHQCINRQNALGKENVGIIIYNIQEGEPYKLHSLKEWSIHCTLYKGMSLHDHECAHKKIVGSSKDRKGKRAYSSKRDEGTKKLMKRDKLLSPVHIRETLKKDCCDKMCMKNFTRSALATARFEMHHSSHVRKMDIKLGVHRSSYPYCHSGQKMTVIDNRLVCMKAWRLVYGVADFCFYKYQSLAKQGVRAQEHGNKNKSRNTKSTEQAVQSMKVILEQKADTMPHRTRTMPTGEKVVEKVMPAGTKWNKILEDVNMKQTAAGLKPVSQSSCSRIRKKYFSDYIVKHSGDNFARCGRCEKLLNGQNVHAVQSPAWILCNKKYQTHLNKQESARNQYYSSRASSVFFPDKVLSIMHDKMDHSKTASPCFANKTKAIDGLQKLPVSVSGILAHGHGDTKYAHFILDKFPADCNQTIGSICKLLRDLEGEAVHSNPSRLFQRQQGSILYDAILEGADCCRASIKPRDGCNGLPKKLPPVLHVQLDNCWKDNKSRFIMCFWSLLVAKGVFNEIKVSFMVVGHTHDDIDALFGRWSMDLRKNDYPTIPLLMKSLMDLEKEPVIPHLIEEVPDFKSFIVDCICIGNEQLVGHTNGRQFLFTKRADGWPIMQYILHSTDEEWLPKEGIKLWKEDDEGNPILPVGEPRPVLPMAFKSVEDIKKGIAGFIENWKGVGDADVTGRCRARYNDLITYWERVKAAISNTEVQNNVLMERFWPTTRQTFDTTIEQMQAEMDAREEDEGVFIGQWNMCPNPAFRVQRDCKNGYFVIVKPSVESVEPIWLGLAKSDPLFEVGSLNHNQILLQWYKPMKRRGVQEGLYVGWNLSPPMKWQADVDLFEQAEWANINAIITAWKPRAQNINKVVIPPNQIVKALEILAASLHALRTE